MKIISKSLTLLAAHRARVTNFRRSRQARAKYIYIIVFYILGLSSAASLIRDS